MRLMIVVLVLTALVVIDQFKFRGQYGAKLSDYVVRMVRSAT